MLLAGRRVFPYNPAPEVARGAREVCVKLIIAIVQSDDAGNLVDALTDRQYRATRIRTMGGFLKEANATILVGVEDHLVDDVLEIIRETCTTRTQYVNPLPPVMEPGELYVPYPVEVEVGGATVFVLNVERWERL